MSARPIGLAAATALVVGSMIGSGAFMLPASLAPFGAASLLGWSLSLGGAALLATVFASLARSVPRSGGAYAYTRHAFGDVPAFFVAWCYWISICCGNGALAIAFAASVGALVPAATATPLASASLALGALWLCIAINRVGLRTAGWAQVLLTVLKFVPLLLFGAIGIAYVTPADYAPFNPTDQSLLAIAGTTTTLTLWAFLGLEAATVPAGAVRDAERTVPRATLLGTLLAGIATLLACTVVIGLVPADVLQHAQAPMAEAAGRTWGAWAHTAIAATAALSCIGALNGWVLAQAQLPLAAANDGLFPRLFARVDPRGTPTLGLYGSGIVISLLVLTNYNRALVQLFEFSILLSTASILVPYAASVAAWFRLNPDASPQRKLAGAGAMAFALFALFYGAGQEALLWTGGLALAGVPVLVWLRSGRLRPA